MRDTIARVTALIATAAATVLLFGPTGSADPVPVPPSPLDVINPAASPLDLPARTLPDSAFAPVDRPGPPLTVDQSLLDQSFACSANVGQSPQETVLFVHGTALTPHDYEGNWLSALNKLGRPYCTVTMPNHGMGDTQVTGQYVVNAIRQTYALSGRKIQIVGHSQGGIQPRFALRFWPDLRPMVDDVVGLAPINHGGLVVDAMCAIPCAAAVKQMVLNSAWVQATNSYQETFAGISYTQVYTATDQFVQPNLDDRGTSSLHTGEGLISNVAVQDICPGHVADHIAVGTADPVAYAIALDALDNPGPADPARVSRAACGQAFMPGVDPGAYASQLIETNAIIVEQLLTQPFAPAEPALAPYVLAP